MVLPADALVSTALNPTKRYKAIVMMAACVNLNIIYISLSSHPITAQISELLESSESVMLPNLNWHSTNQ